MRKERVVFQEESITRRVQRYSVSFSFEPQALAAFLVAIQGVAASACGSDCPILRLVDALEFGFRIRR